MRQLDIWRELAARKGIVFAEDVALKEIVSKFDLNPGTISSVLDMFAEGTLVSQKQLEDEILETGKRTCIDMGIHGLNIELVKLIGRMKYRSSYGQNLLQHSREVANIAAVNLVNATNHQCHRYQNRLHQP